MANDEEEYPPPEAEAAEEETEAEDIGDIHPARLWLASSRKEQRALTDDVLFNQAVDFLQQLALDHPNCPHITGNTNRKKRSCTCLQLFLQIPSDDVTESASPVTTAVARHIVWFLKLKPDIQQAIILEWIRYALRYKEDLCYVLPALPDEDGQLGFNLSQQPLICRSAMQILFSATSHMLSYLGGRSFN